MKRIFRRFREKISFKDLPPPYRENDSIDNAPDPVCNEPHTIDGSACEVLDLLVNCKIAAKDENLKDEVEYAEIEENMGLWHSTPLTHRHKSKISLTWILKENLENAKLAPEKIQNKDRIKSVSGSDVDKYHRHIKYDNDYRKCKSREVRERVVGRNEYYHNLRFKSACEDFVRVESDSEDTSVVTEEYNRRKHRHRHRRKKRKQPQFGYDIRDLDSFLSEASINHPGNIPVVIAYPTTLYQTHLDAQEELTLPLGTVVNAVFKNQQWLYAQTPHGDEGYVAYDRCLPLGILPDRTTSQKKIPCWESSTDLYPRPCGNLTDTEKGNMRGRTRSETRYNLRGKKPNCAEKDIDSLYLKTKSVSNIDRYECKNNTRQILLVVNSDFVGCALNQTLSVREGDVVVLANGKGVGNVGSDWFYVKKRDGSQGYIPAAIAGHGYI